MWYVVVILTIASTLSFVDRQILAVMIEPVREDLGISDIQVSYLIGLAFVLFYTLLSAPAGWLADRYSRRAIMGTGVVAWSLMTALAGMARSYRDLFLTRMGVGVGEATLGPAAYSMMSDTFPKHQLPMAIAVFAAAPFIGVGLANMLGGPLVEYLRSLPPLDLPLIGEVRSWQVTFFAVGLPGLLLAGLVFALPEPLRRGRMAGADTDGAGQQTLAVGEILRFAARRWPFFTLHFAAFLCLATQGWALFAWIISFFVRVHAMGRGDVGLIYGAIALVAGIAGSLVAGWVAGRLMLRGTADATLRLVMLSSLGLWPLAVAMTLVPWASLAITLLVPITFFMAMPAGLGTAALQAIAPNELRGQVVALYLIIVNFLSYLFAPLIVALLTERLYGRDDALGYSLSTMAAFSYPLAAIALFFCLPHFRNALREAERWE